MKYQVTFGETVQIVYAEDEKTAWSKFAQGNALARVHPKAFDRKIEPAPEPPPKPTKKKVTEQSRG